MWRAAKAAEFVPKFWPRSCAATEGSNVTPLRVESTICSETPFLTATCLKDVSHSLKPAALSPQSAARGDATPIVAAAMIENNPIFQTFSRIRRRSANIVVDLETAKHENGLKVGDIGPFKDYRLRRAGVGPTHRQITTQFWLGIGIFLYRWLRQILNRFAYCR